MRSNQFITKVIFASIFPLYIRGIICIMKTIFIRKKHKEILLCCICMPLLGERKAEEICTALMNE